MLHASLGLIPEWQFNADPSINPYLNQHVSMPDGWTQAYTVQPYGASMTPIAVPMPSPLYGANFGRMPQRPMNGLGYLMIDQPPQLSGGMTGWVWDHRKGVALGVVGVVGLALLGGLSALLK